MIEYEIEPDIGSENDDTQRNPETYHSITEK
jgi:hypothetical protein